MHEGRRAEPRLPLIAPRQEVGPSATFQPGPTIPGSTFPETRRSRVPPRSRSGCWWVQDFSCNLFLLTQTRTCRTRSMFPAFPSKANMTDIADRGKMRRISACLFGIHFHRRFRKRDLSYQANLLSAMRTTWPHLRL